jgi:hypothetical protein
MKGKPLDDRPHPIIVEAYPFDPGDIHVSPGWALQLLLHQRTFGPRRLLVFTVRADRQLIGLAHCERTDPPEMGLRWCLAILDDGAAAALAYCDEPVALESPPDLWDRFAAARRVAAEFGVHLLDWFMCDDFNFQSMRNTVQIPDQWWDLPADRRSRG